jgi:hypothetical protein
MNEDKGLIHAFFETETNFCNMSRARRSTFVNLQRSEDQ